MKTKKNKSTKIAIGILALIGGYIWQKKFLISEVDGEIKLYPDENFIPNGPDNPVKNLTIAKGKVIGRIVRSFIAPDYNEGKPIYIIKTKDNLFGFVAEQSIKAKDVKRGWI